MAAATALRTAHVDKILSRPGPSTQEGFDATAARTALRSQVRVLVIGAGGLGCEILANLAMSGFQEIDVIDMDTIDVSNLNRQFLFRDADVGRPKAVVAAEYVERRVPGVKANAYHGKIQDKPISYYAKFQLVVCGLDSVEARRWINSTLVRMTQEHPEDPDMFKVLIDGGTEGFRGQARVILPTITSCYECSLELLGQQTAFPICTIANTPRLPEHCIEWAAVLQWPKEFGDDKKIDGDDPDQISWLFTQAASRAQEFGIEGVTWSLTQGVVKRIIPAIASTNAVIAAACTQEALKFATSSAPFLNNYMMYTGNAGVYTYTYPYEKQDDCPVCGGTTRQISVEPQWTLADLLAYLVDQEDLGVTSPSLSNGSGKPLYFQRPSPLEATLKPNLDQRLVDLLRVDLSTADDASRSATISVTDPKLPIRLDLDLVWSQQC